VSRGPKQKKAKEDRLAVRLVVADASKKTGATLAGLLRAEGVRLVTYGEDAVISYGVRMPDGRIPTLNARAGMADKYEQLRTLHRAGVTVPPLYNEGHEIKFPLLARKRQHRAGKDLMPVFQPEEIPWRRAAGAEFFVEYIPVANEYRCWVFRDSHLGTYEKHMVRPAEYKRIGRNFKNGFAFQLVRHDDIPRGAVEEAKKSVKALGLDFAAVDILRGKDGKFYVLELNTAPGVEGPNRQVVQGLTEKIARWVKEGYPRRA